MPRRDDIQKILLIGSGPIVIGQAAEFDYSGVQACKVLLEEGYEVVLVNSNPATIMTDPEFATRTYIEPLLPGPVAKVIERDEPVRWETDFGTAELTHLNLYDRTVEGLTLRDVPGATVQYHPEAGPGPHDSLYLFDRFIAQIAAHA